MEHSLAQGLVGMMSLFLCERLLLAAVLLLPVVVSIHRLSLRRTHHLKEESKSFIDTNRKINNYK